jgi:uncharacterized protein (TIGR00375 family)
MFFADLHMHGPFSRGCSENITIAELEKFARLKGVGLLGTGDFQHPKWLETLKAELTEERDGILFSKTGFPFMLTTEISTIWTQGGRGRKVHQLVFARDFGVVDQIVEALLRKGRVDYDGRPIFGIPAAELVEMMHSIDPMCEVVPAHAWTPYFGIFGSMSGFDSLEECYGDTAKRVHAIETGMSSTPDMNWRLSSLDNVSIVSFSDSHSFWPWRMGREATGFECDLKYGSIINSIRNQEVAVTIETDPGYGKYHFDGHRDCNVSLSPGESEKLGNACPSCRKPLTIGVLNRVEQLADRPEGARPKTAKPFKSLLPLSEIIAAVTGQGVATKAVWRAFYSLVDGTNELAVLLEMPEEELFRRAERRVGEGILRVRSGLVKVRPGFDGVYGVPVFDESVPVRAAGQKTLGEW